MRGPSQTAAVLALVVCAAAAGCQTLRRARAPGADQLAAHREFVWRRDSTEHVQLYVDSTAAGRVALDVLKFRAERAYARSLWLLGVPPLDSAVHLFLAGSPERLEKLVGRRTNGIAFYRTRVVALVVAETWSASIAHELFHVIAMRSWGVGPVWLNEGMAVYADDEWRNNPLHGYAQRLLSRNLLVPLERLLRDFRDLDELISYPQAASFVKYIFEQYGREPVRALWTDDLQAFMRSTGRTLAEVDAEWRAFLARGQSRSIRPPTPVAPTPDRPGTARRRRRQRRSGSRW